MSKYTRHWVNWEFESENNGRTFCTCEFTRLMVLSQDQAKGDAFWSPVVDVSWSCGSSYTGHTTIANLTIKIEERGGI